MKIIFLFSISVALTGCSLFDYSYLTTPHNTADLRKKGEANVDVYMPASRFNLQTSYAPSNHLGTLADFCVGFGGDVYALDLGAGYFARKNKNLFNVYGGAGIASIRMHGDVPGEMLYTTRTLRNDVQYDKLFVQALYGRKPHERIQWSIGARLSYVHFNSYSYYHFKDVYKGTARLDSVELASSANAFLLQSVFTLELNPENRISFRAQLGVIGTLYADPLLNDYDVDVSGYPPGSYTEGTQVYKHRQPVYLPILFNAGIRININKRWWEEYSKLPKE